LENALADSAREAPIVGAAAQLALDQAVALGDGIEHNSYAMGVSIAPRARQLTRP